MDSIVKLVGGIFSGGTTTVILKLILGLGIGVAVFLALYWLNNYLKKIAHKKTMKDRAKEQAAIDQENRDISDDARDSEDEIEELIRKKK